MNNITYRLISVVIFIIIALTFVSCSDFLERPPLDRISSDDYWKTSKDLENYIVQLYPTFPKHGGGLYDGYGYPEDDSDNIIQATPSEVLNGALGITTGRWINDWSSIRTVNIFFDNYQRCKDDFSSYRHFLGEAHFFRAWFYFILIQKYGDVPWVNHELNIDSELLQQPRNERTLIVDSILVDLDKAITYLDLRSKIGNGRLNKETALAFKSRVALYEGTWQKYHKGTPFATANSDPSKYFRACVSACEELIEGDMYVRGLHADYYELFGLENMGPIDEVLFYRGYNLDDGLQNYTQTVTTNLTGERGITWGLVTSYLGKDGTPFNYVDLAKSKKGNEFLTQIRKDIDPRLHSTIWIPGDLRWSRPEFYFSKPGIDRVGTDLCPTGFQLKKCSNPYAKGLNAGGSETGYILFRYGEVLLNYAEAKFELDKSLAYDALNLLRNRVGMPDFTVNLQSSDHSRVNYGYPISDELYEIRRERRVELALEGHRLDDLKRWAAHKLFKDLRPKGYPFDENEFPSFNPPLDENGLIDYFKNLMPNGYQFRESQDYLMPIPLGELTLNPKLNQNPDW